MSVDSTALERSALERKDRDELLTIAQALGGKPPSRAKKADIVDLILDLTGVRADAPGDAPAAAGATETDAPAKKAPRSRRSASAKAEEADEPVAAETAVVAADEPPAEWELDAAAEQAADAGSPADDPNRTPPTEATRAEPRQGGRPDSGCLALRCDVYLRAEEIGLELHQEPVCGRPAVGPEDVESHGERVDHVGDLVRDRLERRTRDVGAGRAPREPADHAACMRVPLWRAQAGERGDEVDAVRRFDL
jgi:hypothetical protein